jgi:DNA-binding XRE family transcriptional regulator
MTIQTGKLDRRTKKSTKISELHRKVIRNIRELRVEVGFTQSQMASKLKMAQPTYCAIETARCDVMLGTLERIAKILGQPVHVLFAREPRADL